MQFPVFIELRRSLLLQVLLAAMHAAAALCVWMLQADWVVRVLVSLPVFVSAGMMLRASWIVALRLSETALHVRTSDGVERSAFLCPGCAVFTGLAVIRLKREGETKSRSLVVFPDSIQQDDFRKLRVWLRWAASSAGKGAASVS